MDSFEPEPLDHQPGTGRKISLPRPSRNSSIKMIAVVIIIGVIAAAAWFLVQHRSRANGSFHLGPVQVFNQNCSYDDANLCKFLNNWPNIKTYAIASTSTNAQGQPVVTTFKLAGNDKTQLSTVTAGKASYDLITIGNTSYTKDYSDGKWWQQTSSSTAQPASDTAKSFQFNTNPDTNHPDTKPSYRFVSQGACGQQNCLKYQVSFTGEQYQEFIWFDTSDFLLRQSTVQVGGSITTLKYNYGGVDITAPSPTKKLPANQISG